MKYSFTRISNKNVLQALMSLFVVSTKDGWVDLMRRGVDARGIDLEVRFNISALCK